MKKKYWYKTFITVCPACGDEEETKERQYTKKPKRFYNRIDVVYYGCFDCTYGDL